MQIKSYEERRGSKTETWGIASCMVWSKKGKPARVLKPGI